MDDPTGLYHLIAETGSAEHSYSFDSLHNRMSKNGIFYSVNALNQLTQQGKMSYEYDPNGNQSKKTDLDKDIVYQYDALNRLIAVISEGYKTEYLYDSFQRRLRKTTFVMQAGGWIETDACTFLYQGDKEIGALDNRGGINEMRTLGLGNNGEIGAAALLEIKDLILCPLHDFRGNVVALVNVNDGNLVECYRYTSFGEEQIFDKSGKRQSKAICPWRFSSKRIDPETGWVFFGRRYYDVEVGKWTTPDPLRFMDSPNVYSFVRNRPMKYLDPDGRSLSEIIGNQYENIVNGFTASWMREYAGNEGESINDYCRFFTKFRVGTPQDDGIALTFINGIGNSLEESMKAAKMYSDLAGGREVRGVHNATFGILPFDLVECAIGLCGIETAPSRLLKETWNECWVDNKSHIGHIGHSQGMIHTKNTVPSYDAELRQRINVIGVAPAAHVKKDDFGKAIHLESKRDVVPLFDKMIHLGTDENWAPVVMLDPHPNAPLFDHFNDSPTFTKPVQDTLDLFIHTYGAK